MLADNIKRFRKQAGMSQEELAMGLYVVRQTVSKWENGLSVPDAELVVKMSELFHVPVNEILGLDADVKESAELAEELARANEQLAQKNREERIRKMANQKRGMILFLSFLALVFALLFKNQVASACLIGVCFFAVFMVLYRNLALLTGTTVEKAGFKALKMTTLFDAVILLICIAVAVLAGCNRITVSGDNGKVLAMALVDSVMIFSALIASRLPFNRHTGLRLPWTVQDEETWNVAHQVLRHTAVPIALLYTAGTLTIENFEAVTLAAVLAWVGFPALLSCLYYFGKYRNNQKK